MQTKSKVRTIDPFPQTMQSNLKYQVHSSLDLPY
jgi:hypothetical protein